jgi:hypothetical protein
MCTMTWLRRPDGYEVFFNRDEQRTRKPGLPPATGQHGRTRFLAPRDGDRGGTWLAVNEHGLTVGLQNYYGESDAPEPAEPVSRGHLVIGLMDCASADEVISRLRDLRRARYRPFLVVALDRGAPAAGVVWTGAELRPFASRPPDRPVTTSSFDTAAVLRSRRALFHRMRHERGEPTPEWLGDYHRSHVPERGPYSVCMHREDARTVSFSRVRVEGREAEFRYLPVSPCRAAEETAARLSLGGR